MIKFLRIKLAVAFGVILLVLLVTTSVNNYYINEVAVTQQRVLNTRFKTVNAGKDINNSINLSLAALRGYMILGSDVIKARQLKNKRRKAWKAIDESLSCLDNLSVYWTVPKNVEILNQLKKTLLGFRQAQQKIEDIAQQSSNIPSYEVLLIDAVPLAEKVLAALTKMIDIEAQLSANIERKNILVQLANSRGTFAIGLANIRAYLLSGDNRFKERFETKWNANDKAFQLISSKNIELFNSEQLKYWNQYKHNRQVFSNISREMFKLRWAPDWNRANYLLAVEAAPKATQAIGYLQKMQESQIKLLDQDVSDLKIYSDWLSTVSVLGTVISLIISLIVSLVFSRYLQKQNASLAASYRSSNLRNEILELALQPVELPIILTQIALSIEKELPNTLCSILLVDISDKYLKLGAAPNLPKFYNDAMAVEEDFMLSESTPFSRKRHVVEDISADPNRSAWVSLANEAGLKAYWSEPITNNEGKVIGFFIMYYKEKNRPTKKELLLIDQFINLARIAIERKYSDDVIWRQAHYDSLTGLANRNVLRDKIELAINSPIYKKKPFSLLLLDLDNFKNINDSLGHEGGDFVLTESAERIKNSIRVNDSLFRLGGDEFVIMMTDSISKQQINEIGEELLNILSQPHYFKNEAVYSTASIGIATFPDNASSIKSLLRSADQAMYEAKKKGRNKLYFFNDSMYVAYAKRKEMINDLQCAIKNNEFVLNYQPIVNLNNNKVTKAEALIRWNHPTKGLISPLDFIPLAEESGLIVDISNWVFQEVLIKVKHWQLKFGNIIQIKINTSPILYSNEGAILKEWLTRLDSQCISPKSIGIEITENLLMENITEVSSVIDFIRMQGVEVSIDDFGTGYSSFSYLKEFNIDYIKIDKSFVQSINGESNDIALCEAIIMMAKKLKILVIAEGIETKDQLDRLTMFGCDFGQGYYFNKPLTAEKFEKSLS